MPNTVRALAALDPDDEDHTVLDLSDPKLVGCGKESWQASFRAQPVGVFGDRWLQEQQQKSARGGEAISPRSPRSTLAAPIGWVTITRNGRNLVSMSKQVASGDRQRHMIAWDRMIAGEKNSERGVASRAQLGSSAPSTSSHTPRARTPHAKRKASAGGAANELSAGSGSSGGGARSRQASRRHAASLAAARVANARRQVALANELASDPIKVGFAFGGVHPGRLHARGKLVETHKVYFSCTLVGTYLLHVGLRDQSISLPGSPFRLEVVPGPACAAGTTLPEDIALPFRGVVGSDSEQGCNFLLHACDKVGNRCRDGGAVVKCESHDEDVRSNVVDKGDGTYLLTWRSDRSGDYLVHIAIDAVAIVGSPFPLRLSSDTPDLLRTEASGMGLSETLAGKPATIRLQLLDQFSNVAMASDWLIFGMTLIPSGDKDLKNKWKELEAPSDGFQGIWVDEQYQMTYTMNDAVSMQTNVPFSGRWLCARRVLTAVILTHHLCCHPHCLMIRLRSSHARALSRATSI